MATVIAKITCRVAGPSARSRVVKGKPYDDNDPVVRANPSVFATPEEYATQESKPRSTADLGHRSMSARKIESTRSAPGEKRDLDHVCETCGESAKTRAGLKAHQRKHA